MRPIAHSDPRRPANRPMFASVRQPYPRPHYAAPMAMPPPPGAASSVAVVGSNTALHSMVRPGAPPPPPPTLAQLQHQQQRPLYARHPAAATGRNAQAYHPRPNIPFAAAQRPFIHPPASRQIVDSLRDNLLGNPHFYHSVMDLASRGGIFLNLTSSSSTPMTSDPSPSAIAEKHALAATEASTIATVAESTAQVSAKEPLAKSRLSKGQRKRLRKTKKTMEKRAQSYLALLSQSMFRMKIKDLKVANKTCLSKVNGWTGVDLAPDRAAVCRRKLQGGCKADPEFINMVAKELDRMVDIIKGDESMDSKERRRKMKAFRNIAGYHDLIVQSLKADLQPSEETGRMASVAATAATQ